MKKLSMLMAVMVLVIISATGCAKVRNQWKSNGGFWSSMVGGTMGNYVVISQSGGKIMDCWKLLDVMVQSPEASDGWLFVDSNGNSVYVGGDVKIIRCIEKDVFKQYHEYHMESESLSYRQLFSK